MKSVLTRFSALVLGILILGAGCTDESSPVNPRGEAPSFTTASGMVKVKARKRKERLKADITVTALVDPATVTVLEIPGIATVTFPAGTFSSPRTITMTAPAGKAVAVDFTHVPAEEFLLPVTIQLNLLGTEAEGNPLLQASLGGAHFKNRTDIQETSTGEVIAAVDQTLTSQAAGNTLLLQVKGFSGYICTGGRCDVSCESL